MNLVGTLAKAAIGMLVARGVGKMMRGGGAPQSSGSSGGGLGDLIGGMLGGGARGQSAGQASPQGDGGFGGLLDELTRGGLQQPQQESGRQFSENVQPGRSGLDGGLGGMLGDILSGNRGRATTGGSAPRNSGDGMGDLGGLGGLGGLIESLGGGQSTRGPGGSLGDLLNKSLAGERPPEPEPEQNAQAEILLRAMINAAKSDGEMDVSEQEELLEHLGDDVTQEEIDFVRAEMAKPLDVDTYIASVPRGLEQQVYLMSLMAIKLDSQAEAQYLDRLAKGMGIGPEAVNQIHGQFGVPPLYG